VLLDKISQEGTKYSNKWLDRGQSVELVALWTHSTKF
jgi:hypothetical protein